MAENTENSEEQQEEQQNEAAALAGLGLDAATLAFVTSAALRAESRPLFFRMLASIVGYSTAFQVGRQYIGPTDPAVARLINDTELAVAITNAMIGYLKTVKTVPGYTITVPAPVAHPHPIPPLELYLPGVNPATDLIVGTVSTSKFNLMK